MIWTILGIEQTKDLEAIKAAYRERLKMTNPEDNPEGFKELRSAYEEALAYAESSEEVQRDETPTGLWMEKVAAAYADFQTRTKLSTWQELFKDEVLVELGQRSVAEEKFFRFLMGHWFLPQDVFQLIVDEFDVLERREELATSYAHDFIEYAVIEGAEFGPNMPFDLYKPGVNADECDRLRHLYNQALNADGEELDRLLEEIKSLGETHPYAEALCLRSLYGTDREDYAKETVKKMAAEYPDVLPLITMYMNDLMADGFYDEGEALADHILELEPMSFAAHIHKADCIRNNGDIEAAKKFLWDFCEKLPTSHPLIRSVEAEISQWNEEEIVRLEAEAGTNPEKIDELIWCYLQNERYEDALKALDRIDEDSFEDKYKYHNVVARTLMYNNQQKEAIPHLQFLDEYLDKLEDDGTEETKRRLSRQKDYLMMQADCLKQAGYEQDAFQALKKAQKLAPEDTAVMLNMGMHYCHVNDYQAALEILGKAKAIDSGSPLIRYHLALANYCEHNDRTAFEEINEAISMDGSVLAYYTLKMEIMLRNGLYEDAHAMMEFFEGAGVTDLTLYKYYQAMLAEFEEKDPGKALTLYRECAEMFEGGNYLERAENMYYRLCCLEEEGRNIVKNRKDFEFMRDTIDKGIAVNPNDIQCLFYKAWLLRQVEDIEGALELYDKMESFPNHPISIERGKAATYYADLIKYAAEAKEYYEKVQKVTPDEIALHWYIGTCDRYLRLYDEGEKHFKKLIEYDDDYDGYRGLSYIYEYKKDFEKVITQLDEMYARTDDDDKRGDILYRKYKMYAHMSDFENGLATLDKLHVVDDAYYYYRLKLEYYEMFGKFDEAREFLKEWEKSREDRKAYFKELVLIEMMQGKWTEAKKLFMKYRRKMDAGEAEDLMRYINESENNLSEEIRYWQDQVNEDSGSDNDVMHLALAMYRSGRKGEAKMFAESALEIQEERLGKQRSMEALYLSRVGLTMAILERHEEADEFFARTLKGPLCEMCREKGCKDVEIFRMFAAEIRGDYELAKEIAIKGIEEYPHETDYRVELSRLKNMGVI